MSTAVRLPGELRHFLGLPGPQTLLIRGPPGSGKTTLSLALLEAFPGERLLVTSRVSGVELHREFPWLGINGGSSIRVIDTTSSLDGGHAMAEAMPRAKELVKGGGAELRNLEAFLRLPPPLQEAWSHLDESKPTMVIVDSWDALVESFLGDLSPADAPLVDRSQVERLLLRRFSAAPVHLALVLEREDQTQLDYLTNAVAQTQIDIHEERLERWLRLRKLRGIRIENALYPFTLEGGKFDCIEPVRPYASVRVGLHEPEPDALPQHMWPGTHAFANAFGRLPLGQVTLLELDVGVPRYVPELLLTPMVSNNLVAGGPVLLIPEGRGSPAQLWEQLKGKVPRTKFLQYLRFLDFPDPSAPPRTGLGDLQRTLLTVKLPEPGAPPPENDVEKFLRNGGTPGVPALAILHVAGLESMVSAMKLPVTPQMMAAFPSSIQENMAGQAIHGVIVGRTGSPMFEVLRPVAGLHLRVRSRQGRILLHGILPWTAPFLLTDGTDDAPYGLLRVV
jgi:KaiC/GvpD/RAD55 family RecA-like ATPase